MVYRNLDGKTTQNNCVETQVNLFLDQTTRIRNTESKELRHFAREEQMEKRRIIGVGYNKEYGKQEPKQEDNLLDYLHWNLC